MPFDFLHFQAYARRAMVREGRKLTRSVDEILGEIRRDPRHCGHVLDPRRPVVRYGVSVEDVERRLAERLVGARDQRDRRLPVSFNVLLAGVMSWPAPWATMRDCEAERDRYEAWVQRCLEFCQAQFGVALQSIAEHVDEKFPHLHPLVIAEPHPVTRVYNLEAVWPPLAAQRQAERAGKSHAEQRAAFIQQAEKFQDKYFEQVGGPSGLGRYGPRRLRLSRDEWRAQQKQMEALAAWRARLAARERSLDAEAQALAAPKIAEATAAARAETARLAQLCDQMWLKYRSLDAQYGAAKREIERLRDVLVDLGVEPDRPSGLTFG
jgi:hypothetical protein